MGLTKVDVEGTGAHQRNAILTCNEPDSDVTFLQRLSHSVIVAARRARNNSTRRKKHCPMTNQILYWNEVALEANRVDHTKDKEQAGPTLSSRALAIVHLAIYDAYAGVKNDPIGFPHYLPTLGSPGTPASIDAAVAGAAHATLSALYPKQKAFFDSKHLGAGLAGTPQELNNGNAYGLLAAQAILKDRKDDPRGGDDGYSPSMARGAHRVDPDNPGQGFQSPFYGKNSRCFAVCSNPV